jgi:hypothetical protein
MNSPNFFIVSEKIEILSLGINSVFGGMTPGKFPR